MPHPLFLCSLLTRRITQPRRLVCHEWILLVRLKGGNAFQPGVLRNGLSGGHAREGSKSRPHRRPSSCGIPPLPTMLMQSRVGPKLGGHCTSSHAEILPRQPQWSLSVDFAQASGVMTLPGFLGPCPSNIMARRYCGLSACRGALCPLNPAVPLTLSRTAQGTTNVALLIDESH